MPRFGLREDFHSLSVQDLLEARDHITFISAIGRT